LLPSGTATAGDPIPDIDPRQLWLTYFCIDTTFIPNFADELSRAEDENLYHRASHPLLEETFFILDLDRKPEEEWSPHEKRRARKFSERYLV
jgi:hypothetical protein